MLVTSLFCRSSGMKYPCMIFSATDYSSSGSIQYVSSFYVLWHFTLNHHYTANRSSGSKLYCLLFNGLLLPGTSFPLLILLYDLNSLCLQHHGQNVVILLFGVLGKETPDDSPRCWLDSSPQHHQQYLPS